MIDDSDNRVPSTEHPHVPEAPLMAISSWVISVGLWISVAWAIYFRVPQFKRLFADFGTDLGVLAILIVDYAAMTFPVIVLVCGTILVVSRSQMVLLFILFLLPISFLVGLFLFIWLPMQEVLELLP